MVAPQYQESYWNIAQQRLRRGDTKGAIAVIKEGIRANPNDAEGYYNLGNVYMQIGRYDDALANFRKAISIDAKKSKYHRGAGEAFLRIGKQTKQSTRFKRRLLPIPPTHAPRSASATFTPKRRFRKRRSVL